MNTDTNNIMNTDELSTSIQSMVRGTDNEGRYTFMPYSPKAPVTAQEGYRVAKVMYKTNKTTNTIAGENSCLIVRKIGEQDVRENLDKLLKHVVVMLETEQDKIIKGYHLDKVSFVEPEKLSIDSIIEALEAVAVSGRINKDMIQAWFKSYVQGNLAILFADKLGCSVDELEVSGSKLSLTLKVYSDMFGKMASNTTSYQKAEAEKLLQAIDVTCDSVDAKQDSITLKLVDKLQKMINPVNTMELLGF